MLHLHLSTTADLVENVDVPDILDALVKELSQIETMEPEAIKAYHTLHNTWSMGQGAPAGFAHLEVKVLSGRAVEDCKSAADRMYAALQRAFKSSIENGEVALTLELREMEAATYRK